MSTDLQDFKQFMKQRENAARAFVRGDAAPLGGMVAQALPATFFGPNGGYDHGPDQVHARYQQDAAHFSGGDTHFEILHMAASDAVAYWVGFQQATAQFGSQTEPASFNLRVTEVFRREGDAWKLVHRHADSLATEAKGSKK